jgi:hypothetical protein
MSNILEKLKEFFTNTKTEVEKISEEVVTDVKKDVEDGTSEVLKTLQDLVKVLEQDEKNVQQSVSTIPDQAKLIVLNMYANHLKTAATDVSEEAKDAFSQIVAKASQDKELLNSIVKTVKTEFEDYSVSGLQKRISRISNEFQIEMDALKKDLQKVLNFKDQEFEKATTVEPKIESVNKIPLDMSKPEDFKKIVEIQSKVTVPNNDNDGNGGSR